MDSFVVNGNDACLGVCIVGNDSYLCAGVASGLETQFLERHGKQGDGHLFAGGDHDVQFARVGCGLNFLGEGKQAVSFAAHGGYHYDYLMAKPAETGHAPGDILNPFGVAD